MSEYQIWTESTTDLSAQLVHEAGVRVIPMFFNLDGKDYKDCPDAPDLPAHDFYELQRAGKMFTTSQVTVDSFKTHVRQTLEQGQDVLYVAFSSGLSGTFNAARIGAEDLREEFPGRKILVVDTLAASMGEGLLVYLAAQQKQQGKSIEEVAAWVEENRGKLASWFTVDDLHHLKRGGRVSGAAAVLGTMLSIKPVLHVDDEGHLMPVEKVRGRKQSLDALVARMKKTAVNPAEQTIFISHGDCADDCAYVANCIRETIGVKAVHTNTIGPVIGSHSGPGTVALFYMASGRD